MSFQLELQAILNKYPEIKRIRVETQEVVIERGVQALAPAPLPVYSVPQSFVPVIQTQNVEKKSLDPEKAAQLRRTLAGAKIPAIAKEMFSQEEVIKEFPKKV